MFGKVKLADKRLRITITVLNFPAFFLVIYSLLSVTGVSKNVTPNCDLKNIRNAIWRKVKISNIFYTTPYLLVLILGQN